MEKEFLIGACGFYCGSCPSFSKGKCSGCSKEHSPGNCFTLDCVSKKGLQFCGQCSDFPCREILLREKATILSKPWLLWKLREKED